MRIPTRQRLSYRQARNTLCIAFLLGIIFSLSVITANFYRAQNSVQEQIESLVSITISPASRIAYNIDVELAKELVKGLSQLPLIKQAAIIEPSGEILSSSYKEPPKSKYQPIIEYLFDTSPQYAFKLSVAHDPNEQLGELQLIINMAPAGESFIEDSLTLISTVLIQACILAISLLIMFYFMLTKPLSSITTQLSNIHASKDPTKLRINKVKHHQHDEIGLLIETTNEQLSEIESSFHELKEAEQDRQRYTERLEQAVEARTQELTQANNGLTDANQRLVIARQEADQSNQARAIFLANMSHEIRTPLSGVLGMINLALESQDGIDNSIREQLRLASASGESLQQILNDILDIAKVESGKITLENVKFDLRETLEQITSLFKSAPQANQVDLFLAISPTFPSQVLGDPTRIRQVISNLVSNALKFTSKGHVIIEAACKEIPSTSNEPEFHIEIKVEDTGIGMTNEEQDIIFTAFTQATATTTRQYGGTGLGLSLVKQLTDCMNGNVSVTSVKGKGSCFTLELSLIGTPNNESTFLQNQPDILLCTDNANPIEISALEEHLIFWGANIVKIDEIKNQPESKNHLFLLFSDSDTQNLPVDRTIVFTKDQNTKTHYKQIQRPIFASLLKESLRSLLNLTPETITKPSPNKDNHQYNNEQILIVEDNEVNQKVATGLLKKLGFTNITIAENGQIAVDKISSTNFDLILMDCHMPVLDGYEATTKIRTLENGVNVPIIAVTANIMNEDKQRCFDSGMNDFLTKPYRKEDLVKKLDQWLLPSARGN